MKEKQRKQLAMEFLSPSFLSSSKKKFNFSSVYSSQLLSHLDIAQIKTKADILDKKTLDIKEREACSPEEREYSKIWSQCLVAFAEEFLQRRHKLLKLNPSRRKLLQKHLINLSKTNQNPSLQDFVDSSSTSPFYKGIRSFSLEIASFYIFEFLLLKRWVDRKQVDEIPSSSQKLNWKIVSYLKDINPKQILSPAQWRFLKINIYSWYQPGKAIWLKLQEIAKSMDISKFTDDFLYRILLDEGSALKKITFNRGPYYSQFSWELLLKQRQIDERVSPEEFLTIHSKSSTIVAGLCGGQALSSLQSISSTYSHPSKLYALASTDLEVFLGEIMYLWSSRTDLSQVLQIELLEKEKKVGKNLSSSLFSLYANSILDEIDTVDHISVFLNKVKSNEPKKSRIFSLMRYLRNHGLILLTSEDHWPIEESKEAEKIRSFILNHCSIRFIVDFRQLQTKELGWKLPKCICVLEKNTCKETRDKYRPVLIKSYGYVDSEARFIELKEKILKCLEDMPSPCKTQSHIVFSPELKLEIISAATVQEHLGVAPWLYFTDSNFYRIVHELNTYPKKLAEQGGFIPVQKEFMPKKSISIWEISGKALYSYKPVKESSYQISKLQLGKEKLNQYNFILDQDTKESPAFFSALINSAPIQLWYSLSLEQNSSLLRQSSRKDLLKLMPRASLFSSNMTLIPCPQEEAKPIIDMGFVKHRVLELISVPLSQLSIELRKELHQYIIDLEYMTNLHLNVLEEYSHHLAPESSIDRWNIPHQLAPLSPRDVILSLKHLEQASLSQHPSLKIIFMANVANFIVKSKKLYVGAKKISELILYNDKDPMLKIRGPHFLIESIMPEIEKQLGRHWEEISQRITLPVDTDLMQKQLETFQESLEKELKIALESRDLLDCIFSKLLSLVSDMAELESTAALIRRQISPMSNTRNIRRKTI